MSRSDHFLRGFHGGRMNRSELRSLYIADREVAEAYAGGPGLHEVEYESKNPLVLHDGSQVRDLVQSTAAEAEVRGPQWHPHHTSAIEDHVRQRGHDALVIHPDAFREDQPHEDWEAVAGTFGEPQTVILDPSRAKVRRID